MGSIKSAIVRPWAGMPPWRAMLIIALGIVGFAAVATCVREAVADCPPTAPESFLDKSVAVPCSNTTFCYPWTQLSPVCDSGATIVAYKNSNPPPDWCECGPALGQPTTCGETSQPCGTTIWFTNSTCTSGTSCTVTPAVSVAECKC